VVSRRILVACTGWLWAWLAGSALAVGVSDSAAPPAQHEQIVTARSPAELLQALQPWVAVRLQAQLARVHVTPLGAWRWPAQTALPERWRVNWQPAVMTQGAWLVSLQAVPEHDTQPVVDVRYLAREQEAVWRVSAPLRKGDAIGCHALSQGTRLQAHGSRVWQGECEALSNQGLVVRRSLSVDEVLMLSDVGPRPAVLRDQTVHVLSRSQGIVVEASGLALADAMVGQQVPVRIPGHDRVLQATVMAPGQLQIKEAME